MSFARRPRWSKRAPVMHGWPEPVQRFEVLGNAVALVGLKSVTGAILRQSAHQAVACDLCDDGSRRDQTPQPVAADNGFTVAGHVEPIAAVDEHVLGHLREPVNGTFERP